MSIAITVHPKDANTAGVIGNSTDLQSALPLVRGDESDFIRLFKFISQPGNTQPALITGPTGSGKGYLARLFHRVSSRREHSLVEINCAGMPSELLESELFGHEKGAFTGAVSSKTGLIKAADKGILFLDEIGDMPPALQAKMLKAIEDGIIRPVGSTKETKVDVRIIAATNQNLAEMVKARTFRDDLLHRINGLRIETLPIAAKPEVIPSLIEIVLQKISNKRNHTISISENGMNLLTAYSWPGNVREMEKTLETAVESCLSLPVITDSDLIFVNRSLKDPPLLVPPQSLTEQHSQAAALKTIDEAKYDAIIAALTYHKGNLLNAAMSLQIDRKTLHLFVKKHEINLEEHNHS